MKFNSEYIPATLNDPTAQRLIKQKSGISKKNVMQNFTYQELRNAFEAKSILDAGSVSASFHNMNSSLTAFLSDIGRDMETIIGSEFTDSHYKYLHEHLAQQRELGRSEQNLRDRKSHLKRYRSFYLTLKKEHATELSPFQEALNLHLKNIPLKPLADHSGVSISNIKRWRAGAVPTKRSLATIRRLEIFLALPSGALTDYLPNQILKEKVVEEPRKKIPYRENLAKLSQTPYRLKDISDALRVEWLDFLDYKTTPLPLCAKRQKKGKWTASANTKIDNSNREKLWYAINGDSYIPSASVNWQLVTSFLGWMKNYNPDENDTLIQSLAVFVEKRYIEKFMAWKLRRSDNKLSGAHLCFVTFILTLVHPESGYLTQHPELKSKLNDSISEMQWLKKCDEVFTMLKDLKSHIMSSMKRYRDPFEPISEVIKLDNPILAIQDMIARMKVDRPSPGTVQEAIWARDLLLINIVICTTLRLGNLRTITYKSDNSGHLYIKNDNWHLRVSEEEFKNRNGAAKDVNFDIELNPKIKADIDRYLKIYRPKLTKNQDKDGPIFVGSRKQTTNGWISLSRRIANRTEKYLMGCPGVGVHAARHIVSTAILKVSGDYNTAALVLHDKEATVRKNYAHLIPQDGYTKYQAMFPDL